MNRIGGGTDKHTAEEGPLLGEQASSPVTGVAASSEQFYPSMVMSTLMYILKVPSLSTHHANAVDCIMFIFKSLGRKCIPLLPTVRCNYR